MDLTGVLFLAFLWFLFNVLAKGRGPDRSRPRPPPVPRGGTPDATQHEGSQLEVLFRELERRLDETAGPRERPSRVPLTSAEKVEEARVVSLEQEVARAPRRELSQDDQAERVVAARIAAAEARSGALTRADHTAFDARIRQEPADATAVRAPSPEQLRRAMVWREILGPPASLRDPER